MREKLKSKKIRIISLSLAAVTLIFFLIGSLTFGVINDFKDLLDSRDVKKIEEFNKKKNSLLSSSLNSNLSSLLKGKLDSISTEFKSNKISESDYLEILSAYKSLNLCNEEIDKSMNSLSIVKKSNEDFQAGIDLFEDNKFEEALEKFEDINEFSPAYSSAKTYMDKSYNHLTESTFKESDDLLKNNNYTAAISTLEENKNKLKGLDSKLTGVIDEKISQIKDLRMKYLYSYSEKAINANVNDAAKLKPYFGKLTKDNINDFDISSKTNRLVFTDVQKQTTYVFKGSNKNWVLEREFLCSTGVDNKETIVGYFETTVKAPWFYSPKYAQGGKYYVQFKGNYLYHSLPYAQDQTTIVDYTLGEPASHGCIRLPLADSEWLYSTIEKGTTVLIF